MSPKQEIEALGAGIFIREKNVESRLEESDFHRAFREPVIVWFAPGEWREDMIDAVLTFSKRLHSIHRFRFPNICVPQAILGRIQVEFPDSVVEGVKQN